MTVRNTPQWCCALSPPSPWRASIASIPSAWTASSTTSSYPTLQSIPPTTTREDELHKDNTSRTKASPPPPSPTTWNLTPTTTIPNPHVANIMLSHARCKSLQEQNFGMLTALSEDDKKWLMMKAA